MDKYQERAEKILKKHDLVSYPQSWISDITAEIQAIRLAIAKAWRKEAGKDKS